MSLLDLSAVFLVLLAGVGWANQKMFRLPVSVAMLSAGVLAAVGLYAAQSFIGPFWGFNDAKGELSKLNFSAAVLNYLLAFLLFAAGMQVDLRELRRRTVAVWTLATLGVVVSTALVGVGLWGAARLLGIDLPLPWALVFGALISPTDPVAVTAALSGHGGERPISARLGAVLQGESLFNDGFGLVVFSAVLAFAMSGAAPHPWEIGASALFEAGGGLLLGLALGWLAVLALRAIDDAVIEVTVTLALAVGVYALAHLLHASGPIAAAAAGIIMGHYGVHTAFSDHSRRYVEAFWELVDEILNAFLFLLLGLQLFVVPLVWRDSGLILAAGLLTIAARIIVVLPWGAYFHFRHEERGASLILTWGGLRGAISLALALTLPTTPYRPLLLALAFTTVTGSVVIQGLTFGPLTKRLARTSKADT